MSGKKKLRNQVVSYSNNVPYSKRFNVLLSLLSATYLIEPMALSINAAIAIFGFFYLFLNQKSSTKSSYLFYELGFSAFTFLIYFLFLIFFNRLIRHTLASGKDPTKNARELLFEIVEEKQFEIELKNLLTSEKIGYGGTYFIELKGRLIGLSKKTPSISKKNLLLHLILSIPFGLFDSINTVTSIKTISHVTEKPIEFTYVVILSAIITILFTALNTHNLINYYSNVYGLKKIKKSLDHIMDIQEKILLPVENDKFYGENFQITMDDFLIYLVKSHSDICERIEECLAFNLKENVNNTIKFHMVAVWLQYIAHKRKEIQDEQFNIVFPKAMSRPKSESFASQNSSIFEASSLSLLSKPKRERVLNAKNLIGCSVDGIMQWPVMLHTMFVWFYVYGMKESHPIFYYLISLLLSIPPTLLQFYHHLYPLFYWNKSEERKNVFLETNEYLNIVSQNQVKLKEKYGALLKEKNIFIKKDFDWRAIAEKIASKKENLQAQAKGAKLFIKPPSRWYHVGKTLRKTFRLLNKEDSRENIIKYGV